jgi:hypothetical protein
MANPSYVKQYLAFWFQLGKPLIVDNGKEVLPAPVIRDGSYSREFEALWQRALAPESGDCYLAGTDMTVQQLLTPEWEIEPCARCAMPVPMISQGLPCLSCPCNDLISWPNTEMPQPRSPVNTNERLSGICDRLDRASEKPPVDRTQAHRH